MPFVPTQKQVDTLNLLLKQLIRENIEIRVIRFVKWGKNIGVENCEIEVFCLEDEDKYIIYYDGRIYQG